jgi:hypothetical protein
LGCRICSWSIQILVTARSFERCGIEILIDQSCRGMSTGAYTGASDERNCHGHSAFKLTALRRLEASCSTIHISANELQRHDETQHSEIPTWHSQRPMMYILHLRWAHYPAQSHTERIGNHQNVAVVVRLCPQISVVMDSTTTLIFSGAFRKESSRTIGIGGRTVSGGTHVRRHILTCHSP